MGWDFPADTAAALAPPDLLPTPTPVSDVPCAKGRIQVGPEQYRPRYLAHQTPHSGFLGPLHPTLALLSWSGGVRPCPVTSALVPESEGAPCPLPISLQPTVHPTGPTHLLEATNSSPPAQGSPAPRSPPFPSSSPWSFSSHREHCTVIPAGGCGGLGGRPEAESNE